MVMGKIVGLRFCTLPRGGALKTNTTLVNDGKVLAFDLIVSSMWLIYYVMRNKFYSSWIEHFQPAPAEVMRRNMGLIKKRDKLKLLGILLREHKRINADACIEYMARIRLLLLDRCDGGKPHHIRYETRIGAYCRAA